MGKKESGNYHSTLTGHPEHPGGIIRVTKLHDGKPLPIEVIRSLCLNTDEHDMIGPAGHSGEKTAQVLEALRKRRVPEAIINNVQINGYRTFARGVVHDGQSFLAIIEQHPATDRVAHTITIAPTNHEP
ncbi:MAG: hypothetical protein AAB907_01660, partial [Patescibacteria group bacterium]